MKTNQFIQVHYALGSRLGWDAAALLIHLLGLQKNVFNNEPFYQTYQVLTTTLGLTEKKLRSLNSSLESLDLISHYKERIGSSWCNMYWVKEENITSFIDAINEVQPADSSSSTSRFVKFNQQIRQVQPADSSGYKYNKKYNRKNKIKTILEESPSKVDLNVDVTDVGKTGNALDNSFVEKLNQIGQTNQTVAKNKSLHEKQFNALLNRYPLTKVTNEELAYIKFMQLNEEQSLQCLHNTVDYINDTINKDTMLELHDWIATFVTE